MIFDPRHQNSANFHSMENLPLNSFKEGFQNPASVQTWCQDFNCQSKDNSVFHPQNHEKKSTLAQDCVLPPSHSHTEPQTLPGGAWTTTCVKLLSLCKTMGHHLKIPWEVRHCSSADFLYLTKRKGTEDMRASKASEEQWLLLSEKSDFLW